MDLLIEQGHLLKPHARTWHPSGWGHAPAGWTPDRGDWVQNRADELQQAVEQEGSILPREFALLKAEQAHGELLHKARKPWPGWVPILPKRDKEISRAYRELFQRMNPDRAPDLPAKAAQWPGDGRYRFVKGRMEFVPNES
jgi:hypothetical protein